MAIGIPGSHGLFSLLQEGLKYKDQIRICITTDMQDQFHHIEYLKKELGPQPTHLSKLVPDHPVAMGPHDTSGAGMASVWLPAIINSNLKPILWRDKFPDHISCKLVSYENPYSTITNLDLEMAGCIAHQDILQQEVNCAG